MPRCTDGRTNPDLWERSKVQAMVEACEVSQRRCGAWDARIAQRAGRIYRDEGGGYCGPRTASQRSLTKWTREDWRTATGERACRRSRGRVVCDRYLPADAWKHLTPKQIESTRRAKKRGKGQFVPNTPAAKRAGAAARKRR